uniref:Uncharacterized protein n=1 Tax=Tetranychus urticae TaxID=32264 RepID=T1KB36_TETUR
MQYKIKLKATITKNVTRDTSQYSIL